MQTLIYESTADIGDDEDVPLEVEYDYRPGQPSRTYGPPEKCHEGIDPEVEIIGVIRTDTGREVPLEALSERARWHIIQSILDDHLEEDLPEEPERLDPLWYYS